MWLALVPLIAAAAGVLLTPNPPPPPAPKDRIVLLPSKDGRPSAVVVTAGGNQTLLDKSYAEASVDALGKVAIEQSDASSVQQRYGAVLAAQPQRASSFDLYFVSGKDELTPESQITLTAIAAELARRPAPEITVIGHTDSVGSDADNDRLSMRRAVYIRKNLIDAGLGNEQIEAVGRGKRDPLIPTADNIAEPRNRRVQINVR
jgi:outer membrane protein OmpA-like peptidoglycan-associated protein